MMLELHNVTIGRLVRDFSLTVNDGQLVGLAGNQGSGKSTLLRAVMGFIPIDGGHISIDGELLTPLSAPFFRRQTAYVPQHLSLPEDYDGAGLERWAVLTDDERYLLLLSKAVEAGRRLLIVDEPPRPLSAEAEETVEQLLRDASQRGTTVLAVNSKLSTNLIRL